MAEELVLPEGANRADVYEAIVPQLEALTGSETDLIANLANISAVLDMAFDFLWVGFYIVRGDELVLGPFQGPLACTRIRHGKGVCGTAWSTGETQVVPDVDAFAGHIACSSESRSEVVVPLTVNGQVVAVLDIDSARLDDFSAVDVRWLCKVGEIAAVCFEQAREGTP